MLNYFFVFIRPVIEYCCVVYHPLLTVCQSNELERMQKQAVKLAFGWEKDYKTICAEKGIQTMKARREAYIDKFVQKTVNSPRFGEEWYPLRDPTGYNIRDRRPFRETNARTQRYYNSPLSFLRRRANDLAFVPEED